MLSWKQGLQLDFIKNGMTECPAAHYVFGCLKDFQNPSWQIFGNTRFEDSLKENVRDQKTAGLRTHSVDAARKTKFACGC